MINASFTDVYVISFSLEVLPMIVILKNTVPYFLDFQNPWLYVIAISRASGSDADGDVDEPMLFTATVTV